MRILAEVSFVTEERMRRLNKQHRGQDRTTDVLSFPLEDFEPGPDGAIRLGDIVVCKKQAEKKGHKIPFLIRHAMLHLLGVHHR